MNVKSFSGVEVKDADKGLVSAVFSTFGVVDLDDDIVEAGSIKDGAAVRVSAYGHSSWPRFGNPLPPVGKGIVHADGAKAWADMEFFMDTTHGRETFLTIKNMGELQEWSYSLQNVSAERGEVDGKPVRRIKAVDIYEISPVLQGASIGTHTMSVKSGLKFSEHIDAVVADVVKLNERAREVVALRTAKGGQMSDASQEQLAQLKGQLEVLAGLLDEPEEAKGYADELRVEYLRFLARTA